MLEAKDLYIRSFFIRKEIPEDNYLSDLDVVRALQKLPEFRFSSPLTIFVGENGSGKSTLIEALALNIGLNAEGGSKHFNFETDNTHSELYDYLKVEKSYYPPHDSFFLRAESFYTMASYVDEIGSHRSVGGLSLHKQSHGESFMALIENRFWGEGLYILDEPEAALSPAKTLELMVRIHDLVEQYSQFIIATHSPLLLAMTGAQLFKIESDSIYECSYEETEHVQLMRQFLEDPERFQHYLY